VILRQIVRPRLTPAAPAQGSPPVVRYRRGRCCGRALSRSRGGATVILELLNEADLLASIDWLAKQELLGSR
jgi:hypothetical protein